MKINKLLLSNKGNCINIKLISMPIPVGSFFPLRNTIEKIWREITAQISTLVRGEVGRTLCASGKGNQVEVSPCFISEEAWVHGNSKVLITFPRPPLAFASLI